MSFRLRLEEIARLKNELRRQEAELETEKTAALSELPARLGFANTADLIRAIRSASRKVGAVRVAPQKRSRAAEPVATPATANVPQGLAKAQEKTKASETSQLPTGTSLEDPTHFGRLPDFGLLRDGAAISPEARASLIEALAFANRVLHTSRVPAAVWREWRRFEKDAAEALRQA